MLDQEGLWQFRYWLGETLDMRFHRFIIILSWSRSLKEKLDMTQLQLLQNKTKEREQYSQWK